MLCEALAISASVFTSIFIFLYIFYIYNQLWTSVSSSSGNFDYTKVYSWKVHIFVSVQLAPMLINLRYTNYHSLNNSPRYKLKFICSKSIQPFKFKTWQPGIYNITNRVPWFHPLSRLKIWVSVGGWRIFFSYLPNTQKIGRAISEEYEHNTWHEICIY